MMLKSISLTTVLAIALTTFLPEVFLPEVAFGSFNGDAQSGAPEVDDALVCYMQTADGRTLNLNRICGSNANNPNRPIPAGNSQISSRSLSPETNLGGLDIYGRGPSAPPCFGLDDQGRPCPASR